MMRSVSIILIAAILFQTVGCATTRPLARANEVPQNNDQPLIRLWANLERVCT